MTCRHSRYPDCDICAELGELRAAGEHLDPVTDDDYDRFEAGEWWGSFPGMGAA